MDNKNIKTIFIALFLSISVKAQEKGEILRPNIFNQNPCAKNTVVEKLQDMGMPWIGYATGNANFTYGTIVGMYAFFQNLTLPSSGLYIHGIGFRTKNDSPNSTSPTYAGIVKFTFGETPCSRQPIGISPVSGAQSLPVPLNQVKDNGYTYYPFYPPYKVVVSSNIYATLILPQGQDDMIAVYHTDFMNNCMSNECNVWEITNQPKNDPDPNAYAPPTKWMEDYAYTDQNGQKIYPDIDLDMYVVYSNTVDSVTDPFVPDTTSSGNVGMVENYKNDFSITLNMQEKQLLLTNNLNNNKETQLYIYNITGQLVQQQTFSTNHTTINLKSYLQGMYLVKLFNESNTMSQKIIIP